MSRELKVTFSIEPYPDTSGLRIRTLLPWGFYVSSTDAAAARWYFQNGVVPYVIKMGAIAAGAGESVCAKNIDWSAIEIPGRGEIVVSIADTAKTNEAVKDGKDVTLEQAPKRLAKHWWGSANPKKRPICIVCDPGPMVEPWVWNTMTTDVQAQESGVQ